MNGILAIYDEEADYANRLMEYIKRTYKRYVQVRIFTNPDSLKEFLGQAPVHILLINEKLPVDEIKQDNIKNICLLTESTDHSGHNAYPVIYKYQSAEIILKELFLHFPIFQTRDKVENPVNKRIITVFSFGEELIRQLFSYSLAKQYSIHKKTLYINFNALQVISALSGYKSEKDLSQVIYYLKQNNPNIGDKINESIVKRDTLDYMEGVSFGHDLYELTAEDMDVWLKVLTEQTQYEIIIMDTGSYYGASFELLLYSSQIFWPAEDNSWERLKYSHFCGQMEWTGNRDIIDKLSFVGISEEEKRNLLKLNADNFEWETANWALPADYLLVCEN